MQEPGSPRSTAVIEVVKVMWISVRIVKDIVEFHIVSMFPVVSPLLSLVRGIMTGGGLQDQGQHEPQQGGDSPGDH